MFTSKNGAPLITTIIPTFRRPRLLRRAIMSVLSQEQVPLQICVYDNASGDETAAMVSKLSKSVQDNQIKYFCHEKNIGSLANFQHGMQQVNTPFFSFLSDDDYLLPGFYRRALEQLENCQRAMCWVGMTLNVDETGKIWDARLQHWSRDGFFEPPDGFMNMTNGMAPAWTSILFRRDAINKVGLLDMEALGPSDLEFCLRLTARHPYIAEKYPAAVLTLNSESFSATQPMSSFWPGWKHMLEKIARDHEFSTDFKRIALSRLQSDARKMLFRRGANALAAGRLEFVNDAADALANDCNELMRAYVLRSIAAGCARSSTIQKLYTTSYRWMERRIVASRYHLQAAYGHLLKPA